MLPKPTFVVAIAVAGVALAGCQGRAVQPAGTGAPVTLTIGVGTTTGQNPTVGLQQVAKNIALESLVTFSPDGRPRAGLVSEWTSNTQGLELVLRLRRGVKFQDKSAFDADTVSRILTAGLPPELGPAFDDIERIEPANDQDVRIRLRRPSTFVIESLNLVAVQKPGTTAVGTGPYAVVSSAPDAIEMRRNDAYYQERPIIDRIAIKSFPTLRSAWADMLRGQIDMLYAVDIQALDSLEQSSKVRVVTFPQNYAYAIVLNTRHEALKDPRVRVALNMAVDRQKVIDDALKGHGTPATTSIAPQHWAYNASVPAFSYDPVSAEATLKRQKPSLSFTCVTVDGSPYDAIAVDVQRQLAAFGVEMKVVGVEPGAYVKRVNEGEFDAVVVFGRIGGNLSRPYQFWHSGAPQNYAKFSSAIVDRQLDAIRHATDDNAYRQAVSGFQKAIVEDPPAIFLAWAEGARAVSTRFDVPIERGRDFLGTIRLWRPAGGR